MRKALVVDDSRAMRAILARALAALGFAVEEADHGKDALARLTGHAPPDLLLVDWHMPEMDGIDLVRAVRRRDDLARMRILVVSSESDTGRLGEALSAGADEYLMKPFQTEAIAEKLGILGLRG